jgi:hypothetical protein
MQVFNKSYPSTEGKSPRKLDGSEGADEDRGSGSGDGEVASGVGLGGESVTGSALSTTPATILPSGKYFLRHTVYPISFIRYLVFQECNFETNIFSDIRLIRDCSLCVTYLIKVF